MQSTYLDFMNNRLIPKYEGGYGWSKADPGGPTKYGITCYDLAEFEHKKMNSMSAWAEPVKEMQLSVADTIYQNKYANAIYYADLPAGPDACIMDYGVNSGTSRVVRASRAILKIKGGGIMDQSLLDAIKKTDPSVFVTALCAERMHFLHGLRTWGTFGGGWTSRVTDLKAYCLHLAEGGTPAAAVAAVDLSHVVMPKAIHVPRTAGAPTAGGAVAGGAAVAAAGFPWYYIVAGVLVPVIAGVIYEAYEANNASNANNTIVLPAGIVLPSVPAAPVAASPIK
jgi:lysozyme family protein